MFEKYNTMNQEQLKDSLKELEIKYSHLKKREKSIEKQLRKNLYWWFILPLFGFFIFNSIVIKRKENTPLGDELFSVKSNMGFIELELKFIKSKII
ncbi:hypothetical protein [Spiroplasma culicicola]|uniref:Uncharacterized protein n=1 Tax=Spiroplasma culicicola AES-1 TaxID=1276246 RepID=W6A7D3_9MOLU|nr:hypothetical protein [Spiroplasma culicicola]AHI52891.1 hypothetical protein SCULI_v1c05500 [Spiroplasma culicicola AES-1]